MRRCLKEVTMHMDEVYKRIMEILEDKYRIESDERETLHSFLLLSLEFLASQGYESKSIVEDVILLLHTLLDCGYDYRFEETAFDIIMKEGAEVNENLYRFYYEFRPRISKFPSDIETMLREAFEMVYLSGT